MLKKIMLLGATLAALVALAAPAAQAEVSWQTNGVPIAANDVVTFEGNTNVQIGVVAGYHLALTATLELNAGTLKVGQVVGKVVGFHVSNCTGTGALNNLPCTPTTATNPGWDVTLIGESELSIAVNLHQVYYSDAEHKNAVSTIRLTGPMIVDLEEPAAITAGTLTPGAGLLFNGTPATVSGTLTKVGGSALSIG